MTQYDLHYHYLGEGCLEGATTGPLVNYARVALVRDPLRATIIVFDVAAFLDTSTLATNSEVSFF